MTGWVGVLRGATRALEGGGPWHVEDGLRLLWLTTCAVRPGGRGGQLRWAVLREDLAEVFGELAVVLDAGDEGCGEAPVDLPDTMRLRAAVGELLCAVLGAVSTRQTGCPSRGLHTAHAVLVLQQSVEGWDDGELAAPAQGL